MDAYERVVRAMNHEEPDRVPIWELLDNDAIYEQVGGTGDPLQVAARTHKKLGIDVIRGWLYGPPKDWLRSKVENVWGKFLDVNASEWQCVRRDYICWISGRPFDDIEGSETIYLVFPTKVKLRHGMKKFSKSS